MKYWQYDSKILVIVDKRSFQCILSDVSAVKAKNVVTLSVDDIFAQPGIGVPGVSSVQFQSLTFFFGNGQKSLSVWNKNFIFSLLSNVPAFLFHFIIKKMFKLIVRRIRTTAFSSADIRRSSDWRAGRQTTASWVASGRLSLRESNLRSIKRCSRVTYSHTSVRLYSDKPGWCVATFDFRMHFCQHCCSINYNSSVEDACLKLEMYAKLENPCLHIH